MKGAGVAFGGAFLVGFFFKFVFLWSCFSGGFLLVLGGLFGGFCLFWFGCWLFGVFLGEFLEYSEDVAFILLLQVTGQQQPLSLAVTPKDFGVPSPCSSSAGAVSGASGADPWQWMEHFSSCLCQDEAGWL